MKNIVFSISLIAAICTSFNIETAPSFELFNKSAKPIGIKIQKLGYSPTKHIIPSQKQLPLEINDITQIRYLAIYEDASTMDTITGSSKDFKINPQGKKTVYLTWNPAKAPYLYPQTGPLMGMLGKTESGLPLDKKTNIEQNQITKIN
jgi:hypothetical protein